MYVYQHIYMKYKAQRKKKFKSEKQTNSWNQIIIKAQLGKISDESHCKISIWKRKFIQVQRIESISPRKKINVRSCLSPV